MNSETGFSDCYKILSVPFGASTEQVKKRFRELAKKFHPDNQITGEEAFFKKVLHAYNMLTVKESREKYDLIYLHKFHLVIPAARVIFPGSITHLARKGLLRKGLRNKDREKYTGINYDFCLLLKKEEIGKRITANIPLTVRILCPVCFGSDVYCGSCGGKGNYKGFRFLKLFFESEMIQHNRIYEFELSRFRPDRFVHFKKKTLKIKIEIS